MATKPEKQGYIARVLNFLKADDESSANGIKKVILNDYNNQVENKKLEIEDIIRKSLRENKEDEQRLEEAKQAYDESFLNLDLTVKGLDARKSYGRNEFRQQITIAKNTVECIEKEIEERSTKATEKVKILNKEIALFTEVITKLEE